MPCEFRNARVVVMGLGRFGGGAGAVRWLAGQGADVLVTDRAPADALSEPLAGIKDLIDTGAVRLRLGGHDEADFREADIVVVSPAVAKPWANPCLLAAADAGARLTTEIRLLAECLPDRSRVVGVTGSAGKSTTAAMIAHILRDVTTGRVWLGGNIGGSLLPRVHEITPRDLVVLELSSAMLYWLGEWFVGRRDEPGWTPNVAVITNITPNHLDWHGEFAHYERCKLNILPPSGHGTALRGDRGDADIGAAETTVTPLVGSHNRRNTSIALSAATAALGECAPAVDADSISLAAATFTGLPHRLQLVAQVERVPGRHGSPSRAVEFDSSPAPVVPLPSPLPEGEGVAPGWHGSPSRDPVEHSVNRAYNDSKCTTPEAAAFAIIAFEESINLKPGGTGVSPVQGRIHSGTGVSPVRDADPLPPSRADPGPVPPSQRIPVHLIAGGSDKGVDLSPMVGAAVRCLAVWTIGATGPTLARQIRDAGGRAIEAGTLEAAVAGILDEIEPGQTVLLSPGCASLDQFRDYEERGRRFTALIRAGLGLPPADESLFEMPQPV